jgi:hypothetical protein
MPMWQRINYLVGLTRPANYTLQQAGGYMVPPMVQLTLGDFYKNHFIIINSCNVTIPDDASWETLSEDLVSPSTLNNWYYGPQKAFRWESDKTTINQRGEKASSKGRFAQFPRTADISIQMSILEKDRPRTGKAIWGDSVVKQKSIAELDAEAGETTLTLDGKSYDLTTIGATSVEVLNSDEKNTFSKNLRVNNTVGQTYI